MLLTCSGITIDVNSPGEIARFKSLGYVEVFAEWPVEKQAKSVDLVEIPAPEIEQESPPVEPETVMDPVKVEPKRKAGK